jgi:hypothetical protein
MYFAVTYGAVCMKVSAGWRSWVRKWCASASSSVLEMKPHSMHLNRPSGVALAWVRLRKPAPCWVCSASCLLWVAASGLVVCTFLFDKKSPQNRVKHSYLNVCDYKQRLLLAAPFTIARHNKIAGCTRPFHAYLAALLTFPVFHCLLRKGL